MESKVIDYLELLPDEVWALVIIKLSLNDAFNFGVCCKRIYQILLDNYVFLHIPPRRLSALMVLERRYLTHIGHNEGCKCGECLKLYLDASNKYLWLLEWLTQRGVLAGGAAVYERCLFVDDETVGDIDIFILNNNVKVFKECIVKLVNTGKLHSIEISQGKSVVMCGFFQLVLTQHSTVLHLLDNFDLDYVACGYYRGKWYYSKDCFQSHCTRKIKFQSPSRMHRYEKAMTKGFELPGKLKLDGIKSFKPHYINSKVTSSTIIEILDSEKFKPLHIRGGSYDGDMRCFKDNLRLEGKHVDLVEHLKLPSVIPRRTVVKEDYNYLIFRSRIKELLTARPKMIFKRGKYYKIINCVKTKIKYKTYQKLSEYPEYNTIKFKTSPISITSFPFNYFIEYKTIRKLIKSREEVVVYVKVDALNKMWLDRNHFFTPKPY